MSRTVSGPGPASAEPAVCGKCGYAVTGLSSFTCPECGSDLREVGINRPTRRRKPRRPRMRDLPPSVRRGAYLRFAAVIGVFLAACAATMALFFSRGGRYVEHNVDLFRPKSAAYRTLEVASSFETVMRPGETAHIQPSEWPIDLTLDLNDGTSRTMTVDLPSLRARYATRFSNVPAQVVLDEEELLKWMKQEASLDTSNPQVRTEAANLMTLLKRFTVVLPTSWSHFSQVEKDDLSGFTFGGFRGGMSGKGINLPPLIAVMAVLSVAYAAGMLWIRRWAIRQASSVAAAAGFPVSPAGPASARPSHRVLTVLFSDVKDYTARTGQAPREGVLDLVRRHRTLAQPILQRHGGRVVKTIGDALLAVFDSATAAVLAGVEIQSAVADAAPPADGAKKLELRIAVSTGEVTVDPADADVYGPPVNLASRVQQLAEPGAVFFTEATLAVLNRNEVRWREVGAFEVKGFTDAVKVYRAEPRTP